MAQGHHSLRRPTHPLSRCKTQNHAPARSDSQSWRGKINNNHRHKMSPKIRVAVSAGFPTRPGRSLAIRARIESCSRSVVRPSNLKWELPILAATGVLIAKIDRPADNRIQIEILAANGRAVVERWPRAGAWICCSRLWLGVWQTPFLFARYRIQSTRGKGGGGYVGSSRCRPGLRRAARRRARRWEGRRVRAYILKSPTGLGTTSEHLEEKIGVPEEP
jgi:hypothetical protein